MLKKRLGMLLGITLLATSVLSGCGSGGGQAAEGSKATESKAAEESGESSVSAEASAPSKAAEANVDSIVIWAFAEPHARYFEWVSEEYKKDHPDMEFTIELMDNVALADRLSVINASGGEGSPDLIDMEQGTFPRFMTEEQMCLEPLDEYIERDNVAEQMVETRLSLYSYNGHYYGLEHALCPVTMAYRVDLFEEYDIPVPTTWDEYKAAAEEFAKHGIYIASERDIAQIGDQVDNLSILLRAANADFVDADGKLNITDEFKPIVMDMIHMQKSGQMHAWETQDESWPVFAENKVATYFTADWAAGWLRDNVPEQSGKWQMAPLPKLTDSASGVSVRGGTGLSMSKYTNKDKEVLWDFMKFAQLDKDNCVEKYHQIALYPPVYAAMEECSGPVEYYNNQDLGALYQELADEIPTQNQADWRYTFTETFNSNAYDLVEGNITIDEMADILTDAVNAYEESK